jgi:hypothetical protein
MKYSFYSSLQAANEAVKLYQAMGFTTITSKLNAFRFEVRFWRKS